MALGAICPYNWGMRRLIVPVLVLALAAVACGDDGGEAIEDLESFTLRERLVRIDDSVVTWELAATVDVAHQAAETAANLVVGPGGPGYGDRDGNGSVGGTSDFGVLMGLDGEPVGLADALAGSSCIDDVVLGGSWDDPAIRWSELDAAVAAWSEQSDTISTLASRPMRVAGWAALALATDDVADANAFAAVAQTDLDASIDALDC